jgi:hypothetical protein
MPATSFFVPILQSGATPDGYTVGYDPYHTDLTQHIATEVVGQFGPTTEVPTPPTPPTTGQTWPRGG